MLDINFIRENAELVRETCRLKKIDLDVSEILKIDSERLSILAKVEELRSERNKNADEIKKQGGKPSEDLIQKGIKLKEEIFEVEKILLEIEERLKKLLVRVPSPISSDTPIGKDDSENRVIFETVKKEFDFEPKTHIEIAKNLDLIDFERGVKVGGYRGYFLKGDMVMLAFGVMQYALQKMISKGFFPMIPPTLVKEFALFGSGYFKGTEFDSEVDEIYKIENFEVEKDGKKNKEGKFLVGTAEPSLLAYFANEVVNFENDEPIKVCGFSQCYRSEIGSYGRDTSGLYRVHEFMKVEMVVLCKDDKNLAEKLQDEMIDISQEMHEELGLPYRKIIICTGDLSPGKYRQYDSETWLPGTKRWAETGSASIFLDWQSRRLNVKFKDKDGSKKFVYMLNNTALPTPRILISILENYQQKDGSVVIPEILRKFVGKGIIKR
ncbi:MAG: serine--tRNA ligase [Patescibacteria group bacterium]